ncbi:MAG TPA: ABC transporter ATP-binding protein [Candidatus Enterosoma merdigallinarum]|nr:ABC transporter ATP-binding protein [Candidatus Enterosoma merdigallinarum]
MTIKTQDLSKRFADRTLFSNADLLFEEGKIYAIVGESGCGKTTLMNLLSLVDLDFEGKILYDGVEVKGKTQKEIDAFRNQGFAFVFSEPFLLDYLDVMENVSLPRFVRKQRIDQMAIEEKAHILGVFDLLDKKVTSLSEGEKQRISVLRALMTSSPVLVCDEPTSHLDGSNADRLLHMLLSIAHEQKRTVIVSTHEESTLPLFDVVYRIKDGRVERLSDE